MKAKIYPLDSFNKEVNIPASCFLLHLEIILASLANKTSVIKNLIESEDIADTISWCRNIGAIINKNKDKLIIKGINNTIFYNNSLFETKNAITAKLMIPLLCINMQPAGIKANEEIVKQLHYLKNLLENNKVSYYENEETIRVEKCFDGNTFDLTGISDMPTFAGFLLAIPLLNHASEIKFDATEENQYYISTLLKLLKKFNIEYRHSQSGILETDGYKKYKSTKIVTEMDVDSYIYACILTRKIGKKEKIVLNNYYPFVLQNDNKALQFVKKNVSNTRKNKLKRKHLAYTDLKCSDVDKNLSLLVILGLISKNDVTITNLNDDKAILQEYQIIRGCLNKIGININKVDDTIVVNPLSDSKKDQIDPKENKNLIFMLSYLALFLNTPIVIRGVDSFLSENKDFYKYMKDFGAKIEIIHN